MITMKNKKKNEPQKTLFTDTINLNEIVLNEIVIEN